MRGPSRERLMERLVYSPETGEFRWRNGQNAGAVAGGSNQDGYRQIRIDGQNSRLYAAHKLAWLYMFGEWVSGIIDHRDRNPANNAIDNLRKATRAQNTVNSRLRSDNASGYKGVFWHTQSSKWVACITVDGVTRHLGKFTDPKDGARAYSEAAVKHYGEFAYSAHSDGFAKLYREAR